MNNFLHAGLSKGGTIICVLVVLLVLERLYPMARVRHTIDQLGRNFSLVAISVLLSPLIVIPVTQYASGIAFQWRPVWWSGWLGLGLDLLILDCWIYLWHRLNHVVPFLWRFHEVHHLDETLDASSALRFHFGEVILSSLVRAGVIIALGVPFTTVVIFETVVTVMALFQHSNLRLWPWLERALSLVIVTPSIHWVHHHAIRADTDSNYSTVLSIWDRIFGSKSQTVRDAELKIGVEGLGDMPLLRLILRPFFRA